MILELLLIGGASYVARNFRAQWVELSEKKSPETTEKDTNSNALMRSDQQQKVMLEGKNIDHDFFVASVSTTLAIVGYLVSPIFYVLSVPGWIYVSIPAIKEALEALHEKRLNVNTIYTITLLGCYFATFYVTGNLAAYFYVLSKKLFFRLRGDSQQNLVDVFGQHARYVWVMVDNVELKVPFESLKCGDIVVVGTGETIPADGVIIHGCANIDQHILTGEAQPVEKEENDEVFAATVILSGHLHIKVNKAGKESTAAQIGEILNQTTHFKTNAQRKAEALTNKAIVPTLVLGGLSLPFIGPLGAVTVVNAHFGYRMAVVASLVMLNYLQKISHAGILIKNAEVLDVLPKIDTIVFDKTGTLTIAQPTVGLIHCLSGYDENTILGMAAAAEYKQTHPAAQAILQEAELRHITPPTIGERAYEVGYGLSVTLDGQHLRVGSIRFMEKEGLTVSKTFQRVINHADHEGISVIMVALGKRVIGAIELLPTIRPEAAEVLRLLREEKLVQSSYIVSGDADAPTKKLAETIGIDHYFAEVLPQHKADIIAQLQAEGKTVCYVGDGINDAIALKQADVSISICGASTVATDTAQVILMRDHLMLVCHLLRTAREFDNTMDDCFKSILTPSIIGAGGALFLGFNLIDTVLLKQIGLTVSLFQAMQPVRKLHLDEASYSSTP